MNPRTLKALKGGIKKWERIVKSTKAEDRGPANCPLCKLFLYADIGGSCSPCPIKKKTRVSGCQGSPYRHWVNHHQLIHPGCFFMRHKGCPDCLRLAKEELEFLRGLLPKREKR